jgi:hypothetical protein
VIQRHGFERQLQHPPTRVALDNIHLGSFQALLDLYVGGPQELRAFAGSGPIVTDDRPLVKYFKSLSRRGLRNIDPSAMKGRCSCMPNSKVASHLHCAIRP